MALDKDHERDEFEKWFEEEVKPPAGWSRRDGAGNGDYFNNSTDWAWQGWWARACQDRSL